MKKLLFFLGAIVLLLFGIMFVLMQSNKKQSETEPKPTGSSFVSTTTNPTSVPDTPELELKSQTLQNFKIYNFLQQPDVVADTQNSGYFYLGNTFTSSQSGQDSTYVILFQKDTDFFNITLLKEPLKDSRLAAEAYLKGILGLTNEEMCVLRYSVAAPIDVSQEKSGIDLKFSFCSGSTEL